MVHQRTYAHERRIVTHQELFAWLSRRLPDDPTREMVSRRNVHHALGIVEAVRKHGSFPFPKHYEHSYRPISGTSGAKKIECGEALLSFCILVYLAAADRGRCTLEMANQLAIEALCFSLGDEYIRVRKREIRSTELCYQELGVSIQVPLRKGRYDVDRLLRTCK